MVVDHIMCSCLLVPIGWMLLVHIMCSCVLVLIDVGGSRYVFCFLFITDWMLVVQIKSLASLSGLVECWWSTLCVFPPVGKFCHRVYQLIVFNWQLLERVEKIVTYIIDATFKETKQTVQMYWGMSVPVSLSAHQSLVVSFAHDHWGSWNHRAWQICAFLPLMLFVVPPGALLRAPCVFVFRCHLEPFLLPDTLQRW